MAFIATTAVPLPAAAWLFGSGLIGLVGIARRKKVVKIIYSSHHKKGGLCAAFSTQLIMIGYIAGTVITTTS